MPNTPQNPQNISFFCNYDPANDQLLFDHVMGADHLQTSDRDIVISAAGYIIGGMNNFISGLVQNSPAPLHSLLIRPRIFLIELPYNYLTNLQRARQEYGEEEYRVELSAIGQTLASYVAGLVGSNIAGPAIGQIIMATPAGRIGGMVIGGLIATGIYDQYLRQGTEELLGITGSLVISTLNLGNLNPDVSRIEVYEGDTLGALTLTESTILQGHSDSDTIIATNANNIMYGGDGFDTYYFPELGGQNTIIDPDFSGKIVIGNGAQSVALEGNAIPKKDADGNIIEGQWMLNGYDLVRIGDNLVIVEAGGDLSSLETPRITIVNFPFNSPDLAFGITLNKKVVGLSSRPILSRHQEVFGSPVFGSPDRRGIFFSAVILDNPDMDPDFGIASYNAMGERISLHRLTNNQRLVVGDRTVFISTASISSAPHALSPDGNVAFIYGVSERRYEPYLNPTTNQEIFIEGTNRAYLVIVDPFGNVVTNNAVNTYSSTNLGQLISFVHPYEVVFSESGDIAKICFQRNTQRLICASSSLSGQMIGQPIEIDIGRTEQLLQYFSPYSDINPPLVVLPTGHQVIARGSHSNRGGFDIRHPIYQNLTAAELPESTLIESGESFQTPADVQSLVATFADAALGEVGGQLAITPVPDSVIFVRGAGFERGEIDLSAFGLTDAEIAQRATQIDSASYSMEELLRGEYDPAAPRRERRDDEDLATMSQLMPKRGEGLEIDEEELLTRSRRNVTAVNVSQEVIAAALANNPEKFTVLTLPAGNSTMQVIFPGVGREEFLTNYSSFLYLDNQTTTTQSPNLISTSEFPSETTTTTPRIGNQDNPTIAPTALLVAEIIAGIAAVGVITYKFATDKRFRQNVGSKINDFVGLFNPKKWGRRSEAQNSRGPTIENEVFDRDFTVNIEDQYVDASAPDGPLAEDITGQTFSNPLFKEESPSASVRSQAFKRMWEGPQAQRD